MTESALQEQQPVAPPATKPSPLPNAPTEYPHFLRTPRARWWKGALAIVTLLVTYLVLSFVLAWVAIAVDVATGRYTWEQLGAGVVITPMIFLANNLTLAGMIPLGLVIQRLFFGQPGRYLSSVGGAFRWSWFGRAALIIGPLWVVYVAVMYVVDPSQLGRVSADAAIMLAVVLLTTPLQSAGEEYGFRGLINRAAGSWFRRPRTALVVGLIVSSLVFAVAHLSTDPWLNGYYVVFGATLAVLAWRTGGLEVPVLVHAVNNLLLLIPVAVFGDLSNAFDRGYGVGGPILLLPTGLLLALIPLTEWWARRHRVVRTGGVEHA